MREAIIKSSQSDRSDARRFLLWLLIIASLLALDAVLAAAFGWQLGVAQERGEGRVLLLLASAAAAIHAIGGDHRPHAVYGLATEPAWERHLLVALGVGLAASGAVYVLAYASGALDRTAAPTLGSVLRAAPTAIVAPVFALLQEVTYRGYLNTVAADRLGWRAAIPAGAALYALTAHFEFGRWADPAVALPHAFGLFLVGALLGLARLYHGSLVVPIALATGPVAASIVLRRSDFSPGAVDAPASFWVPPDPTQVWQAPSMWLMMGVAIAGYLILLARKRGVSSARQAPVASQRPGVMARLVRGLVGINPFSNLWMLAPLDLWIRQLWRARFRVSPRYVPRLAVSLVVSAAATVINLPERLLLPRLIARRPVPDPVIVVGVHRSGTSHLQRLLALDPQFVTPRTHQVINPSGFVLAGRILTQLLGPFLPWRRPIDSMEFSLYQPDEDEFAIALSSALSPYWSFVFPRDADLHDRFIYPERMTAAERLAWQRVLAGFLRKICLGSSGRPLLKSPFHAARLRLIAERFPGARFVHIHRHPYVVYRSNVHLQERALSLFQVQKPRHADTHAERLLDRHYLAIEGSYYDTAATLPESQSADVSLEDLEEDPVSTIKAIYRRLDLTFSDAYEARLNDYLRRNRSYRKNRYPPLPERDRARILEKLKPLFERWNYPAT